MGGAAFGRLAQRFPADSVAALVWGALGIALVLALAACAGALLSPSPLLDRLGLRAGHLRATTLALLILGMLALSHALDGILSLSGLREQSGLVDFGDRLQGASGGNLALALLGLAVGPGIAEELFCRGFLQRGLRERWSPAAAIAISALVFGALHVEPVHAFFATVLGLYLGAAAQWADSTRAAILCHVCNNLASVALMAAQGRGEAVSTLSVPLALALCGACIWRVRRDVAAIRRTAGALPA